MGRRTTSGLLGGRVTDVVAPPDLTMDGSPPEAWRSTGRRYGPTIAVYRGIADDPERIAALDPDLTALAARFDRGTDTTVWTGNT